MEYLKKSGLASATALVLLALAGPGAASGTELYRFTDVANETQLIGSMITGSLKAGSSLALLTTSNESISTCTGSEIGAKLASPGGEAAHPRGYVGALTFSGCSHSTTVHQKGSLTIEHIAGTPNGTVRSFGMEVTVWSTDIGVYLNCRTGAGTHMGTLTGASNEGHATLDIDAAVNCGHISARLTGTYTITSPTGLNVEAAPKSGTELYRFADVANETQRAGTIIAASLKTGTSLLLQTTSGEPVNTCTGSEMAAKVESSGGEATYPSGKVSSLAFSGCTHPMTVHSNGSLRINHLGETTHGTVISIGMKLTLWSTTVGLYVTCETGETDIGTLTGVANETHATLDVNAILDCGLSETRLTGTYTITTPTGLNVEAAPKSGTELYKFTDIANETQRIGTVISGSLKAGSSLALKSTSGATSFNTCTGSELATAIESPGSEASHPSGKVSTLAFTGCNNNTTVHAKGSLEVKHIAETTHGTVTSSALEVTSFSAIFGTYLICKTGAGTHLGTLTGVNEEGHASLDIIAALNCGITSARLTGTYTITTPTGLNVEAG
jgi:hypothetical protein